MKIIIKYIIYFFIIIPNDISACRLWCVVSYDNYLMSENNYSFQIIQSQANYFQSLGSGYPNGWSLYSYNIENDLSSLYRSELYVNTDTMYQAIFDSLVHLPDTSVIILGHLRAASSGAIDIPNPHPFTFNHDNKIFSLIHNGTLNKDILFDLITENGSDSTWILNNPPSTYNQYPWYSDSGWINVVDSELYLLWIMKNIIEGESTEIESIMNSLQQLENANPTSIKNIIFTSGEIIYAYRSENDDDSDLYYSDTSSFLFQDSLYIPNFISVMSQVPTNEPASLLNWNSINNESLLVINEMNDFQIIENFINHSPIISLSTYPDTIGVDFITQIGFSVHDIDFDSLSVQLVNNPDWVTLNDSLINIIPNVDGAFEFSIYLSDGELSNFANIAMTAVNYKPVINSIYDVPDDEGGWVFTEFKKSIFDNGDSREVEIYHIERKTDENWISVGSCAAYGEEIYTVQVMTVHDSSTNSINYTTFRIIASMNEGVWFSNPDSGYSINNISLLGNNENRNIPKTFSLNQNYPNPFNPVTTLRYDIPENSHVNIIIYDILGRQVRTLVNQTQDAGFKSVLWDATNDFGKQVSAGVYLYQIQAGEFVQTKKMVLLK